MTDSPCNFTLEEESSASGSKGNWRKQYQAFRYDSRARQKPPRSNNKLLQKKKSKTALSAFIILVIILIHYEFPSSKTALSFRASSAKVDGSALLRHHNRRVVISILPIYTINGHCNHDITIPIRLVAISRPSNTVKKYINITTGSYSLRYLIWISSVNIFSSQVENLSPHSRFTAVLAMYKCIVEWIHGKYRSGLWMGVQCCEGRNPALIRFSSSTKSLISSPPTQRTIVIKQNMVHLNNYSQDKPWLFITFIDFLSKVDEKNKEYCTRIHYLLRFYL